MQLMTIHFDGKVERTAERTYEEAQIELENETNLFKDTAKNQTVWMSYGDQVTEAPASFRVDATSESIPVAAMSDADKNLYALQFHPEVDGTEYGAQLLRHFVYDGCDCPGTWTLENYIESDVKQTKEQVGDKKVLCALRGGVDSSVVAALIHKAIGDQLTCIFVHHGLLRKHEADDVMDVFAE